MIEIFKKIPNHEKYYASNMGRIYSVKSNKYLSLCNDQDGYKLVKIDRKTYKVHRLVCETFIQNINNYNQVNHKNFIKSDNRVDNLEWCSAKYNSLHRSKFYKDSIETKEKKRNNNSKNKRVLCVETGIIYRSSCEASRQMGCFYTTIYNAIKTGKKIKGYHWRFV